MDSAQYGRLFITNFNIFVFSRFRTNLLAENHSIICAKTRFTVVENYEISVRNYNTSVISKQYGFCNGIYSE